jgi:streptomycin 6-kinase
LSDPEESDRLLWAAVERQLAMVDARVSGGLGVYEQERDEARNAVKQLGRLRRELNPGRFVSSLKPDTGKPQLLLLFDSPEHGKVVLKVYGRRRPSEAAMQCLWWRHGARVPRVLAAGNQDVSWILMEFVPGSPLTSADITDDERLLRTTRDKAELLTPLHRINPTLLPEGQPLERAVLRHLKAVISALDRHGYAVRPDWLTLSGRLLGTGPAALLHGDLTVLNSMRDHDGNLWLLDCCGYIGPAAFDGARWCARAGGLDRAEMALDAWLEVETGLDQNLASALLGVEMLMEAGVHELVKDEQGLPASPDDERTLSLVATADRLLDRWLDLGGPDGRH